MVELELSSRITTIPTLEAENVKLKAENAAQERRGLTEPGAVGHRRRRCRRTRHCPLGLHRPVAYVEITSKMDDEASMRITSQTPELASLRNADDDCPVAVHETKTVLRETLVFGPSAGGRRRLATTEGACKSPLSVARLYETGVVDVVLPCVTCDGAKSFPVFTPRELKERPDRFVIEGHLGGKFDQLYEVYCPFARAECEANPNLLCSIAEVPDDGSDPEHNFSGGEAMPEPEPEPRSWRILTFLLSPTRSPARPAALMASTVFQRPKLSGFYAPSTCPNLPFGAGRRESTRGSRAESQPHAPRACTPPSQGEKILSASRAGQAGRRAVSGKTIPRLARDATRPSREAVRRAPVWYGTLAAQRVGGVWS